MERGEHKARYRLQANLASPPVLPPVFLDRESEGNRLREAILKRESLMIEGPAGIGKTALIANVIHSLPGDMTARCLYLAGIRDLQDLLRRLIRALYEAEDPRLRRQLHGERVSTLSFGGWLKELSSSRLKGAVYRAAEGGDYRVFLDHPPPLTRAVTKVIKELFWMRRTPVYVALNTELQPALARLTHFLYWGDRERLTLGPLPHLAARTLVESCIERFGLERLDLTGFREEVLDLSKHVPGAITKMCALAADARYQYGSRIKIKSVYIDYLMTGHDVSMTQSPATKRSGT